MQANAGGQAGIDKGAGLVQASPHTAGQSLRK